MSPPCEVRISAEFLLAQEARLDQATGLHPRQLGQLCGAGRVRVLLPGQRLGRAVLAGRPRLPAGARVVILAADAHPGLLPEEIPLDVLFADEHLLMIDKPAGLPACPDVYHPAGTLANALRGLGGPLSGVEGPLRPGIVHRLDLGTSGVLVVARTDAAHRALAAQFAAHSVHRRYLALVRGGPEWTEREVETWLGRRRLGRKAWASVGPERGKRARTRFVVLLRQAGLALLAALPATGRTHQIRVHLGELGHPIVGDTLYGGAEARHLAAPLGLRRPALHAAELVVRHPQTGAELRVSCPPSADLLRTGLFDR